MFEIANHHSLKYLDEESLVRWLITGTVTLNIIFQISL